MYSCLRRVLNLVRVREPPCRNVRHFVQTFCLYNKDAPDSSALTHADTDAKKKQIDEIVRHMQVLALLRNPNKDGAVLGEKEQVDYLLSAMDIANKLMEVDTDGVEPLHFVLENEVTYLRPDKPLVANEIDREITHSNSQCYKFGMYIAPPIPATKVSRKVTKGMTDNQDEEF